MTKNEMKQLWAILALYRPKDKRLKDKDLRELWYLTFEPYSFETVRNAVIVHFREKRFFPSIPEITTRCPTPQQNNGAGATVPQPCVVYGEADQRAKDDMERMRRLLAENRV